MSDIDSDAARFPTGVENSEAIFPDPPSLWSFSSLKDIEACPRRYMLTRASYPDLECPDGYPQRPSFAALMGDIVHDTLEEIVDKLVAAGCGSSDSDGSFEVMTELGGISAVLSRMLAKKLEMLESNPRLAGERYARLARDLTDGLADARIRVQEYLSRATFSTRPAKTRSAAGATPHEPKTRQRYPARLGANPEVTVISDELGLMGRIDLLDMHEGYATILDYKTGEEDESHINQLRLYALLWDQDRVVNPDSIPAKELTAAYRSRDVKFPAPTQEELRELIEATRSRIAMAFAVFDGDVPEAKTAAENCDMCQVRQLCGDYWISTEVPPPEDVRPGEWFDCEASVGPANGVRSVWLLDSRGEKKTLLRTTPTSPPLAQGKKVRILGLRRELEPDIPTPVALMSASSEVFTLTDEP